MIKIGGIDYGMAAEIQDDEQGHTWQLFTLLDGTRTREEIVREMQKHNPSLTASDVEGALEILAENGYLEDAALIPPATVFSAAESERYRRNFEFFSYFYLPPLNNYDFQERLKRARVTVLGIGGLGSFVALGLAAAGVGHLHLVDDDIVELCNLNRQVLYTESDIGHSKCEAAVRRLREINPHVTITAQQTRINSREDAEKCIAGQDLLVCAADRPRILLYEWLNAAALKYQVPWIRGANDGMTVNLFLHEPGKTACFECEQQRAYALSPWYKPLITYAMEHFEDRTINPCTAPVAGLIGNLAALEVVKHITGVIPPAIYNRKLVFDLRTMEIFYVEGERQENCPACGTLKTAQQPAQEVSLS